MNLFITLNVKFTFLAWLSDPSLRPELSYLFNSLEDLNSPFISDCSPRGLNPKRSDMEVIPIKLPPGRRYRIRFRRFRQNRFYFANDET